MYRRRLMALTAALSLAGGVAMAEAPTPENSSFGTPRFRGTVDSVKDDTLQMTTRDGKKVSLTLPAQFRVASVFAAKIEDIKPGSYVGSAAVPQADGSLKALQVTVFPPAARGAGEGFHTWDLTPTSTMTNGTVGEITTTNGRVLTVKYGTGEKHILVPNDVPVVTFEPGTRDLLVPGAKVIVNSSRNSADTLTVTSISVGKNGMTPPM